MSSDVRKKSNTVLVIGAGPAGISAAIEAAENGADCLVLEHMAEPLQKLLITGNGRCNFSNTDLSPSHYHGDPELLGSVLSGFSCDDILDYMADTLGVEALEAHYRFSENGYFYPSTNKAATVRDALLKKCKDTGVRIFTSCTVKEVKKEEDGGFLLRTLLPRGETVFPCDRVIFATGSNAHPETGSDSSIYKVLMSLGVTFHTFLPALCAIKSKDPVLTELKGLRCDGSARLCDDTEGTFYESDPGEIQFNPGSVSGLPVMNLSGQCAEGFAGGHEMRLWLTLTKVNNKKGVSVPSEIVLKVTGTDGFPKCQCCRGGVDAAEIEPETLMYRKIPGIYFAGELIDVDGECGGYNLHFAFATGIRAGRSAAR